MKKHKVEIPEGYEAGPIEYDLYNDEDGNKHYIAARINLIKVEKQLPKTWEEYLKKTNAHTTPSISLKLQRFPSQYNEAFEAFVKLIELRDHYNDGIERTEPYSIYRFYDAIARTNHRDQGPLVLNNTKLGIEFGTNFRDLIQTAKPLL